MSKNANRNKGHRLERELASFFRSIGFDYCKTSRAESKTLDNCGIDLCNIPLHVQAKSGYDRRFPRYCQIYDYIKEQLALHYPPEDEIHNRPIVLVHKNSGRRKQDYTWTVTDEFMRELLDHYYNNPKKVDELPPVEG